MLKLLEPFVRLVGHLTFRNKLRATAAAFGIPLLIVASILFGQLNSRVSELENERSALALQPALHTLVARLYAHIAASAAVAEGAYQLTATLKDTKQATQAAVKSLASASDEKTPWPAVKGEQQPLLGNWTALAQKLDTTDVDALMRLQATLRTEIDRFNDMAGLQIDGNASSSRAIDVITTDIAGLIETTGEAARLGSVVLIKKSARGKTRNELTLHRGNFNTLVQWSLANLEKVGRDHPELAPSLSEAGSRLNTAYGSIQEAVTIKMLDTTDFDMTPEAYLGLTGRALNETLAIGQLLVNNTDTLLAARLGMLKTQRNVVLLVMLLMLAGVITGFVAAYISIMRALGGLSDAVNTMSSGDLSARVSITTRDEIGTVGSQFNSMAQSLMQRTAELREKTNNIHNMLQNLPQGILTIVGDGKVHPEYSAFLETIYEQDDIAHQSAIGFILGSSGIGADTLSQIDAAIAASLGEDRMNFDFNAHLLVNECSQTMPDGRIKCLDISWSPICDDNDVVEKIMVCVRDITHIRELEQEAEGQRRELALIGQILKVNQEKFQEFIESARHFIAENHALLTAAPDKNPELVTQLFRNMHTIKGNARTYGLLHLTNHVHEAEQAYDELRKNPDQVFDKTMLLAQLGGVESSISEYAHINESKLGRKGPGRRGNAEKYAMVERAHLDRMYAELSSIDLLSASHERVAALLMQHKLDLELIGTELIANMLDGVIDSMPSLARELGKEPPKLVMMDNGIYLRNQISDLLQNTFMHLYRNAMDHGIETSKERTEKGKPASGTIQLELSVASNLLVLRLTDDGRGLALGKIRAKAIVKGLIDPACPPGDEEIAKLIFAAGFSTSAAVTEVSGRGVGMDAVQSFVKREGGQIVLRLTDEHNGADFRAFETVITLPGKYAVETGKLRKTMTHAGFSPKVIEAAAGERLLSAVKGFLTSTPLAQT
ncbi:MAG: HAMP domain-containing protein [Rhodoferax sp.]